MNSQSYILVDKQGEKVFPIVYNENDFLASFQSNFINVNFRSYFFIYLFQIAEILFITVISTLTFLPSIQNDSSSRKVLNDFLTFCYLTPSFYGNKSLTYLIIGIILLSNCLIIGYTFYITWNIKKSNVSLDSESLKPWIILQRLFLPLPGYIIGCNLGYYLTELTSTIYLSQLLLIIMTGIIWCWSIISTSILYNSSQYQRKNDICQIRHNFVLLDTFITILPMFQALFPYIFSIFVSSSANSVINVCITFLISFIVIIFVAFKHVYYNDSMNQYVIFLFLIKIPLSFIWVTEQIPSAKYGKYVLFSVIIIFFVFILFKIFTKCNLCNHQSFKQQSKQNLNQSNLSIEEQSQETQVDTNQSDIFDPFIDCPYPFNLISLTYQDIILIIYLIIAIFFMIIINGFAAQRMPISNALPDLIHDHFSVADSLRSKKANSSFQISNVVVLIQVFLLILFFLTVPQYLNVRRFAFIYASLCYIRTISFLITSLPAPCTGSPKCPCSDPEVIRRFKEGNAIKIAMTWLFGLGMFLKYPQCGDLIISGHTMWLWAASRTLCSVMNYVIPKPFNWLSNSILIALTFLAMSYIVLSKNHYSIDVWFGFLLAEFLFTLYSGYAELSIYPLHKNSSLFLKIIKFIETRPPKRILMQTKMILQNNE